MKKNLLALFALGAIYSAYAQDTNIKDAVIVKINPNTLFYNGGTVNVTTDAASATTEKIINQGNIQIKGLEAELNYDVIKNNNFNWSLRGNFTSLDYKVKSLYLNHFYLYLMNQTW